MTATAEEKPCGDVVEESRQQCTNKAFATIHLNKGDKTIDVCRLHLAYRVSKFPHKHKPTVVALNESDQTDVDSLIKFLDRD